MYFGIPVKLSTLLYKIKKIRKRTQLSSRDLSDVDNNSLILTYRLYQWAKYMRSSSIYKTRQNVKHANEKTFFYVITTILPTVRETLRNWIRLNSFSRSTNLSTAISLITIFAIKLAINPGVYYVKTFLSLNINISL